MSLAYYQEDVNLALQNLGAKPSGLSDFSSHTHSYEATHTFLGKHTLCPTVVPLATSPELGNLREMFHWEEEEENTDKI